MRSSLLLLIALSTFGFGCSIDEHKEASTQSQSDPLLLSSTVKKIGSVTGSVEDGSVRTHTLSPLKTAVPLLAKEERLAFTITGTSITPWSCALRIEFKSNTGSVLKEIIHECGAADSTELLGSIDSAYNPAKIVVTEMTGDSGFGADYVIQYVHSTRGSSVNQAGTSTASAPTLSDGQRFGGSIWLNEPLHYYSINVPAGKALSLSGDMATMVLNGNVTIKFQDAAGTSTTCANKKLVKTMSSGTTTLSCSMAAYTADTIVYIIIDNASAWGGAYDTQMEYDLTPTLN